METVKINVEAEMENFYLVSVRKISTRDVGKERENFFLNYLGSRFIIAAALTAKVEGKTLADGLSDFSWIEQQLQKCMPPKNEENKILIAKLLLSMPMEELTDCASPKQAREALLQGGYIISGEKEIRRLAVLWAEACPKHQNDLFVVGISSPLSHNADDMPWIDDDPGFDYYPTFSIEKGLMGDYYWDGWYERKKVAYLATKE